MQGRSKRGADWEAFDASDPRMQVHASGRIRLWFGGVVNDQGEVYL